MKSCKFIIGMCILLTFTSFHTTYAQVIAGEAADSITQELKEIKDYLKEELEPFYEASVEKQRAYKEKLRAELPPGIKYSGLLDMKKGASLVGIVFANSELPDLFGNVTNIDYLANAYADTLSQWNILGTLWFLDFPKDDPASASDMSPNQIMNVHLSKYCDPSHDGSGCNNSNKNPDSYYADLNMGYFLEKSISSDDESFRIAIRNVVNPLASSIYRDKMSGSNVDNEKFKRYLAEAATLSTAFNSLNHMYKIRKQITTKDSKKVTSLLKIMENEGNSRFLNKDWQADINQSSKSALLREITNINAFLAWMSMQQYLQNERIELLLAAQVSGGIQAIRSVDKLFDEAEPPAAQN